MSRPKGSKNKHHTNISSIKSKDDILQYPGEDGQMLTYYQKYKNMQSWKELGLSDAFVDKLCIDMMLWADQDDSYRLTQFLRRIGLTEPRFYWLCDKYPKLADAHWYLMAALADRREIGALKNTLNASVVLHSLSMYCTVSAAAQAFREKIKQESHVYTTEELNKFRSDILSSEFRIAKEKELNAREDELRASAQNDKIQAS